MSSLHEDYTPEQLRKIIHTPWGNCPIRFEHFWIMAEEGCCPPDTIICAWFWEVREYGLRRGEFFTAEAIAYWGRSQFDKETGKDLREYITKVILEYADIIHDHGHEGRGK